ASPVRVLANKTRAATLGLDARGQLRRTLERYLGVGEVWFVPWDPKATDAGVLAAAPVGLVAGRSALSGAIRRFVGEAVDPPVPVRQASQAGADGRETSRRATRGRRATRTA
ncbi:MAG: hypothetical protein WBP48_18265, partial [Microbacterium sp.]